MFVPHTIIDFVYFVSTIPSMDQHYDFPVISRQRMEVICRAQVAAKGVS